MFKITIEAETLDGLYDKTAEFLDAATAKLVVSANPPAPTPETPPTAAGRPRGRPVGSGRKKTEAPEPEAKPDVQPTPLEAAIDGVEAVDPAAEIEQAKDERKAAAEPTVETVTITEADFRAKMQALVDGLGTSAGMEAGVAILQKYGAVKLRDVKPEHYAAIVADVDARLTKAA